MIFPDTGEDKFRQFPGFFYSEVMTKCLNFSKNIFGLLFDKESRERRAKSREQRAKSKEQRAKSRERRAKSKEPAARTNSRNRNKPPHSSTPAPQHLSTSALPHYGTK